MSMYSSRDELMAEICRCIGDCNGSVGNVPPSSSERVLANLLCSFLMPSFGSQSKNEMLLDVFAALDAVGYIKVSELSAVEEKSLTFELVKKLRVTNAKARSLIYSHNLRTIKPEALKEKAQKQLSKPVFKQDGQTVFFEITDPYLADYIKDQARHNDILADGSFSPTVVTVSYEGFAKLVDAIWDDSAPDEVNQFVKQLENAIGAREDREKLLEELAELIRNRQQEQEPEKNRMGQFVSRVMEGAISEAMAEVLHDNAPGIADGMASNFASLVSNVVRAAPLFMHVLGLC